MRPVKGQGGWSAYSRSLRSLSCAAPFDRKSIRPRWRSPEPNGAAAVHRNGSSCTPLMTGKPRLPGMPFRNSR